MNIDKLIEALNNEPDDVIELLEQITDANIQELKDRSCTQELANLKVMAQDVLIMLQATASGGHLVDVNNIKKISQLLDGENE